MLHLCRASSETLQGQEQQLVSSVLGQGLRSRDPLPGRAALARPFHLWEPGHPPCVAGVISTTAASPRMPGTVGGSISHRLPLLLHFCSHHSPLRFHKPPRHTALASRLSCLQDFGPSLRWEMSFTPFISRNLLHRDPHSAPCTCALRLSSRGRGLCAPAIRKGLAWPGRTDLMPKAGQFLTSLLRFPWEKGPPCRSRPSPLAAVHGARGLHQALRSELFGYRLDGPVRERGCPLLPAGAVAMKSEPASFFSGG